MNARGFREKLILKTCGVHKQNKYKQILQKSLVFHCHSTSILTVWEVS